MNTDQIVKMLEELIDEVPSLCDEDAGVLVYDMQPNEAAEAILEYAIRRFRAEV